MRGTSNKISIRALLTLVIFSATVSIVLLISLVLLFNKTEEMKRTHVREAATISRLLTQDFLRVILLQDMDVTIDMVKKIEAFPDIAHASIFNKKNTIILNYTHPDFEAIDVTAMDLDRYATQKDLQYIITPLSYNGSVYGQAHIHFINKSLYEELILFFEKNWYLFPALLILSFFLSLFFQKIFTQPIRELTRAVEGMESNNESLLNFSFANSKEMTSLFSGFQSMSITMKQNRDSLADQKERLHVMLESIADGVIATDEFGVVTYLNPAAEHITRWDKLNAINSPVQEVYPILSDGSDVSLNGIIDETILTGIVHVSFDDTIITTRDGEQIPIKSTISPIRDHDKTIIGTVIIFQNVSETRVLANKLRHQASHDALTDLVNRTEFENQLVTLISSASERFNHALLYLDLDQFKIVNDTSGHTAGDVLLKQVATLLCEDVREADTVARLGGDEFAVLLENCTAVQAIEVAEKIRVRISEFTFIWQDKPFKVGVSIGVVPIEQSARTADDLLRDADLACYAAKDSGRNRVHVYRVEDKELKIRHSEMNWVSLIRNAIDEDKLILYAQHIRSLDNLECVDHFEVLIRYVTEHGKVIAPGVFLPAVERYGLAPELDRWVIENILGVKEITDKLKENNKLSVNINLSGHSLNDPSIVDFVTDALARAQLPPRTICFEITETAAVANLNATAQFMRKMKLLGCEFALDDFGIGVSSFAYLKNLPVDYLKIDGSFVQDIDTNLVNKAMVTAINDIGHVMNIKTVAEFVSNAKICTVLQSLDIDYAQGYFVHKPCPVIEIFNQINVLTGRAVCAG